jgi:hypothetical protein
MATMVLTTQHVAGQGALTLHSISSVPMAALPSRAHYAPQLTATIVMTHGKDKTHQCHLHAPYHAPRRLMAVPTTNGDDGDKHGRTGHVNAML